MRLRKIPWPDRSLVLERFVFLSLGIVIGLSLGHLIWGHA